MTDVSLPPLVEPGPELTPQQQSRYARHLTLPGIGIEGQRRLLNANVLVVGAGGLGSPIILYLAAAGVGRITIVDDDRVEQSNLQRQVIHDTSTLGALKAESAKARALALNPDVQVTVVPQRLGVDNAEELFAAHDLVLDGADNFATRYLSNDAAELTGTPLIWGTIAQFSGQASVFWPGHGPMLRDLFPDIPAADSVPSCAAGGVLGAMVGIVGSTMAVEALKVITGVGTPAVGKLLLIDVLNNTQRALKFTPDPDRAPVTGLEELADVCAAATPPAEISATQLRGRLAANASRAGAGVPFVLDVREPAERADGTIAGDVQIPLGEVKQLGWAGVSAQLPELATAKDVVVYCRSGARSAQAIAELKKQAPATVAWWNLQGGMRSWNSSQP